MRVIIGLTAFNLDGSLNKCKMSLSVILFNHLISFLLFAFSTFSFSVW